MSPHVRNPSPGLQFRVGLQFEDVALMLLIQAGMERMTNQKIKLAVTCVSHAQPANKTSFETKWHTH